ncbi:MAG: spore maturation protein [Clostridiaceae bacterium]|nr:spore maturation protein [Clostridiaceae bacterium]
MNVITLLSNLAMPVVIFFIIASGLMNNVNLFEAFTRGAKEGLKTAYNIAAPLVGLMVAIGMFRASGALDLIVHAISPVCNFLKIPPEIMPLALMRPISGSASLAIAKDILTTYGADSLIGKIASILMSSSETTFYTITVYFAAVSATNYRYSLKSSLLGDLVVVFASVAVCRILFS